MERREEEIKKIEKELSPEWLLECVMIDNKTLVIAPKYLWGKGIKKIKITKSKFESQSVLIYDLEPIFKKKK